MAQILNRGAPLGDYRCTCFQQGLCSTTPWTLKTWTGGRAFGNLTGALSWAGDWTEDLQAMVWVQVPEGKHVIEGKKGSFTFFRLNGSIRNKIAMLFSSVLWLDTKCFKTCFWRQAFWDAVLDTVKEWLALFLLMMKIDCDEYVEVEWWSEIWIFNPGLPCQVVIPGVAC